MPALDSVFAQRVAEARNLVRAGELARTIAGPGSISWRELHPGRLELLYEIALLKTFIEWENFLEGTFYRYMCGYVSTHGQATLTAGSYHRSVKAAEAVVLGTQSYTLWHNPANVLRRAQKFMVNCRHEVVFSSNIARLQNIAAVRHRVAHGQDDAKSKFDAATMAFAGRRYAASRPGRFLRDWDSSVSPAQRWLASLGDELVALASQII